MAGILTNKQGTLSYFRLGVLVSMIGLLAVLAGFVFWQLEHQARRSPFNVAVFPNAEEIRRDDNSATQRNIIFRVQAPPEDVVAFYQAELDRHLDQDPRDPLRGNTHTLCVRVPVAGEFTDYAAGDGTLPFYHRCGFDNAFFGSQQSTVVEIQPGVRADNLDIDNTGYTFIIYDQRWSR